ncbi:8108_t:CDS:2, partial [Racocetra fulgida]
SLCEELAKSIPIDIDRLKLTDRVILDPKSSNQLLIEFQIIKSQDVLSPSVQSIIKDADSLIKHKFFTNLALQNYTVYLDETYDQQLKNQQLENQELENQQFENVEKTEFKDNECFEMDNIGEYNIINGEDIICKIINVHWDEVNCGTFVVVNV